MSIREKIKSYIKPKKALLVTGNATDRNSWKRILHEFGMPISQINGVSSYVEAQEEIESGSPEVLFINIDEDLEEALEIIDLHNKLVPNRAEACSLVCSDRNSVAISVKVAESYVDGMLLKPYNQQDLTDLVELSLEEKVTMKKEVKFYFDILADIKTEDIETAQAKVENYMERKPDSAFPYFLNGLIREEKNNLDEAIQNYLKALEWDEKNYQALTRLFDLYILNKNYQEALPCAEVLCEEYPVSPDRIPDILRCSIACKNFENVTQFCEMILSNKEPMTGVEKPVAAALALSAKVLSGDQDQRELVVSSALKAISLTERASIIFVTALGALLTVDNFRDTKKILDEIPNDEMTEELLAIDLLYTYKQEAPEKAFVKAQNLVKFDKANEESYEILIQAAHKIGKSTDQIEDIIFEASKVFPEKKDHFKSLIS